MSSCQGSVSHTLLKTRKVFYCCVEEWNFAEQTGVKLQIRRCVNEKWRIASLNSFMKNERKCLSCLQHFPNSASISSSIDHISPEWTPGGNHWWETILHLTQQLTVDAMKLTGLCGSAGRAVVLWLRGCRFNFSFNPLLCINGWLWLWCKMLWVWKSYKFSLIGLQTELIAFRATKLLLWQSGVSRALRFLV